MCIKYGSVHFHNDFFSPYGAAFTDYFATNKKTISDGWEFFFFFQNFRTWHIFFPYFKVGRCMSVMQCYATMLQKYSPVARPALILMDRYSEMWNLNMPSYFQKNVPKKSRIKLSFRNVSNSYKILTSFWLSNVYLDKEHALKYANILNGPRSLFKNQYDYENVRFLPFHWFCYVALGVTPCSTFTPSIVR